MPIKRPPRTAAPLSLELVDLLLLGHCTEDDTDPTRAQRVYDPWVEFDHAPADLRAFWQQHRAWLLVEWTRRGRAGRPWAEQQFLN